MNRDAMNRAPVLSGRRTWLSVIGLVLFIGVSLVLALDLGSVGVRLADVWAVLRMRLLGLDLGATPKTLVYIVYDLRLPRALMALAIGGGLGVAGAAMQAITQNVMAEPYTIGVSSGALLGVSLVYWLSSGAALTSSVVSLSAFGGALMAMTLVYVIGRRSLAMTGSRLILTGLAVSIVFGAASNYFIITMPGETAMRSLYSWMLGSLSGVRWSNMALPFSGIVLATIYFFRRARDFDTVSLGFDTALSLGVNVDTLRRRSILLIALITGLTVAAGGIIGLIGFIIPHIVRFLVGPNHRALFRFVFLGGALFLLWIDVLARTAFAPSELPVGIFSALCGGPVFLWLLLRRRRA